MTRKWTLDRIEFDNETYEITRPDVPDEESAARDRFPATPQLGLMPAAASDVAYDRQRHQLHAALAILKGEEDPLESRTREETSAPCRLH